MGRWVSVACGVALLALVCSAPVVEAKNTQCLLCTLVVSFVEQIAMSTKLPLPQVVKTLCSDLSPKVTFIAQLCESALDVLVPVLEKDMLANITPDQTCLTSLPMCTEYPTCKLFKQWPPAPPAELLVGSAEYVEAFVARARLAAVHSPTHIALSAPPSPQRVHRAAAIRAILEMREQIEDAAARPDFYEMIQEYLQPVGQPAFPVVDHLPLIDFDNDRFSTIPTLRGTHWRGRDCNDSDSQVYPGRAKDNAGPLRDHNCNGIFGVEPGTGLPYETKFCSNSSLRGLINLGDSATAHFAVPPSWLTPQGITNKTYGNVLPVIEDELDWPQCSGWTGYETSENCPWSRLPMNSFYMRLRERNLCMHRDYQNIGVNGGASDNMKPPNGIIASMKSRNGTDAPALVIYALIGNDVCGHHKDFDHMTKPADFERNTLESLDYLQARLAPGSLVVFMGLVDGRVLFNTMSKLRHPIGALYSDVYDYLNCLDTNPCWGWLNGNSTARDMTTQRAMELNAVYPKIIAEHSYSNFKMKYIYADMQAQVNEWVAQGHAASELIEAVDGFHPSQTAHQLTAKMVVDILAKEFPEALGPINPWNSEIKRIFGNQGGH